MRHALLFLLALPLAAQQHTGTTIHASIRIVDRWEIDAFGLTLPDARIVKGTFLGIKDGFVLLRMPGGVVHLQAPKDGTLPALGTPITAAYRPDDLGRPVALGLFFPEDLVTHDCGGITVYE